jgi:hypothetical protein
MLKEGVEFEGKTEQLFDQYKLIILAVFLSKGGSREKAQVLFENFDINSNNKLSRTEFFKMWDDSFTVIAKTVYYLTRGHISGLVNPNQLKSYMTNLELGKKLAFEELTNAVFIGEETEEVPKELFLNRICTVPVTDLFTTSGFRSYLYNRFLNFPESDAVPQLESQRA